MKKFARITSQIRNYVKQAQMTHAVSSAKRHAKSLYNAVNRSAMQRLQQVSRQSGVTPAAFSRLNPAAGVANATKGIWGPGSMRQKKLMHFKTQLQKLPGTQQELLQKDPGILQNFWQAFQNSGKLPIG